MRFWPLTLLATSFLLQACTNGGGDNNDSTTNPSPARPELIVGNVNKGVVRRANVEVLELGATGGVVRTLGVAQTDENGTFQTVVPTEYAGGPVKVVATAVNNQSAMVCDVLPSCGDIAFGSEVPLDGSFSLSVLLSSLPSKTVQININPLSDLAHHRALELGPLTPTSIAAAISEVNNLFAGLDVVHSPFVNIVDIDALNDDLTVDSGIAVAIINSALARIAFAKGISLSDMLIQLRSSFAGGIMQADLDTSGTTLSMQEIVTAARAQFTDLGLTDTLGILVDLQTDIDIAIAQGSPLDPVASPNAGLPALERGRAMVSDLRTWGYSIANSSTQADTFFSTHFSVAEVLFFTEFDFARPIGQALDHVRDTVQATGGVDGTYTQTTVPNLPSGTTVTLISEPDGTKRATLTSFAFNGNIGFPAPGATSDRITLTVSGTAQSRSRILGFTATDTSATFSGMSLTIQLQTPRVFELATLPTPAEIVSVTHEGALALTVRPLDPLGRAPHRYLQPGTFKGNIKLTYAPAGFAADNSPLGEAQISLQGNFQGEGLVAFKLALNMDAKLKRIIENSLMQENGEFSISFAPSDAADDGLQLTLAGRGSRTDNALATVAVASVTIAYQGRSLRVESTDPSIQPSPVANQPATVIATMTNQDGTRLIISGTTISQGGELVVDGTTVGTVTRLDKASNNDLFKISYIDGTFETLN